MKTMLNIVFLLLAGLSFAQVDSSFIKQEQELKVLLDKLRASNSSVEKEENNQKFSEALLAVIQKEGAFAYPFASLKTMGSITSPDKTFRLFNWNVEQDDRSNKYYCYILRYDEKKKSYVVIQLKDNSANMNPRTEEVLDENSWLGALYYKIIPVAKSGKTVYTVLGWDGNTLTNTKLVDVISFTSNNKVKFGSPIFKLADGTHKRLFFEHSKKAFMSLNYDEAREVIIFDHLSPETPSLAGFYEYYVPDFSYDQLVFKNNKWTLEEDIVGVNKKENSDYTLKYLNKKNGEVESADQKNKWIDPSDKNAPGGANTHVAVVPSDANGKSDSKSSEKKDEQTPKIGKRKKKEEFSMLPNFQAPRKTKKKR